MREWWLSGLWCGPCGAGAPVDHTNSHMKTAATRITWRVRFGLLMGSDKVRKGGQSKKYNQRLKAAETAFEATQKSLQAETARQQRIIEKNLILSELLYCADRLQSVYEKHLAWLETGGSGQQQPGSSRACDHHEHSCMQQVRMGQQMELHDDAHWVIYLLETATWEQLQHVLAMTTADWVEYHRQYCGDLIRLFEVSLRCPEVQVGENIR